jgi:5,10-methylene-tetrahydrofolate dehydrogenase/methenyl tetrahydrofolate cyclohydrolase
MSIIFDGKEYEAKKKMLLQSSVDKVRGLGVVPHLATLLIGSDPASS